MNRYCIAFAAALAVLLQINVTVAQTETQTFESAASAETAGWLTNDEGRNEDRGCQDDICATDLGWKDSNLAGGAAGGEGGGLLHRSGDLPIGFYADTTIGILNLEIPFFARGKVALANINFDGHTHLGFFDAARLLDDPFDYGPVMGFQIAEPGGAVAPNFRWGYIFVDEEGNVVNTNTSFVDGLPDSESLDFEIDYKPDKGDGLLTLRIGEEDPVELELTPVQRGIGATFTGFGVFTGPYAGAARAQSMEIFIDDVTYTSLDVPLLAGDYNSDGVVDTADIDLQAVAMQSPTTNLATFDENGDGTIDDVDRVIWVTQHAKTWFGDANFDGSFTTDDLVAVFAAGKYETGNMAVWSEGDWTGDMVFDSGDLVAAFSDGGFELGPRQAVAAVPEPSSVVLLLLSAAGLVGATRRRNG